MTQEEIFGALAVTVGLAGFAVYALSICKGRGKPHFFTWLVWTLISAIGYLAQLHEDAGAGSWVLGANTLSCLVITALALKYGETSRTRFDYIALATSLLAIVPWILTDDPLGSVILISAIDIVAMGPTFRKSWADPYGESMTAYFLGTSKFALSLLAMETVTLTSALYPLSVVAGNTAMMILCFYRRRAMRSQ